MSRRPRVMLATLAALSTGLYAFLLQLDAVNGLQPVTEFLAAILCLFLLYALAARVVLQAPPGLWKWVAAGAVLFRLMLLPAGLPAHACFADKLRLMRADVTGRAVTYERFQLFDDDIWRYLWDGHVSAAKRNPYRTVPNDPSLDALAQDGRAPWADIRDNVSYPNVPTIYPPAAQWLFWLAHWISPGSVLTMKALLTLCDLAALVLLTRTLRVLGKNPALAVLYGWNPLVIKVFAGSGHIDALAVTLLAAMAYCLASVRPRLAGVYLGLAILTKISPLVLVPFFWRRAGWCSTLVAVAVVGCGYVPFFDAGGQLFAGLLAFGSDWQFNAGVFGLLRWVAGPLGGNATAVAKAICGMLLLAVFAGVWRNPPSRTLSAEAAPVLGCLVLLSPAVMPWYTTWTLPFAVISGQRVWLAWTWVVCLAFFVMIDGRERWPVLVIEYGALAAFWFLERQSTKRRAHETDPSVGGADARAGLDVCPR